MSIILEKYLWNKSYVKNINIEINEDYTHSVVLNNDENKRINTVTKVAAISRGQSKSNNPKRRYDKLLKEAAPNLTLENINDNKNISAIAGRPLEFTPIVFKKEELIVSNGTKEIRLLNVNNNDIVYTMPYITFLNDLMPFSYLDDGILYTNIRACVNSGIPYFKLPYNKIDKYFIVEVKAPYFVFAQIRTHGRLSQIAASERVISEDDYWLPDDALVKVKTSLTSDFIEAEKLNCIGCDECKYGDRISDATTIDELIEIFLELPIGKVQKILKLAGYNKEIYNRWPNHLKYKTWMIGGYINDPKAWPHFLLEREAFPDKYSSWVQKQTQKVTEVIRDILLSNIN